MSIVILGVFLIRHLLQNHYRVISFYLRACVKHWLARVHLILAVALINIFILKCKSIADIFDALTSTSSYRSKLIEPAYIIQCRKALIYDPVLKTNVNVSNIGVTEIHCSSSFVYSI
jgi:hypothetical protein